MLDHTPMLAPTFLAQDEFAFTGANAGSAALSKALLAIRTLTALSMEGGGGSCSCRFCQAAC
jgi:hypothetical protein